MSWTVQLKCELGIIETTLFNTMIGADFKEATLRRIELQNETNIDRVLIDATNLTQVGSVADIYNVPNKVYEESSPRRTNIAFIMPKTDAIRKVADFYVDACFNAGWIVQPFEDRSSAIEWLLQLDEHVVLL